MTLEAIANHIATHLVGNQQVDVDSDKNNTTLVILDPF
jgi:hypothetical protein